jgi:MTH538 TIR-like domain (DUF1863)
MLYKAFVSYSHAADRKSAPALQSALHRFAKPWYRLRAIRVFRDKTTLAATPGLWSSIEQALNASEYFLLMASPEAATSQWVQREIQYWLTHKSAATMLIVLTGGDIVWDRASHDFDWHKTTALPKILQQTFTEEPLYIDLRWAKTDEHLSLNDPRFREAIADIAAPLHSIPKDQLVGEDVRQHRKTVRLAWSAVAVLMMLTLSVSTAACIAVQQQKEAERQRQVALARQLAAQAELLLDQQPNQLQRSVLLAVESLRRSPSLEAEQILRHGSGLLLGPISSMTHEGGAGGVSFHEDGNSLLTLSAEVSQTLQARDGPPSTLSQSPINAVVSRTWQVAIGRQAGSIVYQNDPSRDSSYKPGLPDVAVSPNGRYVGLGDGRQVWVLDGATTHLVSRVTRGESLPIVLQGLLGVNLVGFSRDGTRLVTGGADGTARVWEVSSGREVGRLRLEDHVDALALSPHSR